MSSSALTAGLRQMRGKLAAQIHREESDEQLLHAFAANRDDSAFAVLVRRHGPMVFHICRRVSGHQQDAEDAFQATFLVLARSMASLRNKATLASFLHGIAYRTAMKAKQSAARRRKHEGQSPSRTSPDPREEISWREVRTLVDEEIARLPEIYGSVFVLCCLENLSRAEAAQRLGLKERTVLSRLAEARKRLQGRLSRRGVALTAALATTALAADTASALPSTLLTQTTRSALALIAMGTTEACLSMLSPAVAALVNHGWSILSLGKVKSAILLLAVGLLGGVAFARFPRTAAESDAPPTVEKVANPRTAAKQDNETVIFAGRVVDPDGKPIADAKLFALSSTRKELPIPVRATSNKDGSFRFSVAKKDFDASASTRPWDEALVVAMADGYGLGLPTSQPEKRVSPTALTLRLPKDDLPIQGRVLDLQGKPVPGALVRVIGLRLPNKGDLAAVVEALKSSKDAYPVENTYLTSHDNPGFARAISTATVDAAGRFQLKGVGRERIAVVEISGPTIETRQVRVMTRTCKRIQLQEWSDFPPPRGGTLIYYGASFDHLAGPTTPIVGVVRDKDTKMPLAGAVVTSWKLAGDSLNGRTFIRTTTDKEGRYRLVGMPGFPRGEGSLIKIMGPEGKPYLEVIEGVPAAQGIETVSVDVELKLGVWIKGRVTDKVTGQPVSAQVEYFAFEDNPYRKDAPGFWPRFSTKDDGTFQFVSLPGRGVLGVRARQDRYLVAVGVEKFKTRNDIWKTLETAPPCMTLNYHTLAAVEPAKDAESLTCNISVDPGRTLNGTVLDLEGKPLAGARLGGVTGYIPSWEHQTQPMAEFTVYALKAGQKRNVLVLHEEKRLAGSLVLQGDEKGPLTIKLGPWGVLTGRFVTEDGRPRGNAELTLRRIGKRLEDPTSGYHIVRSFQTDKDGNFRIEALVPGWRYTMHFINKGKFSGPFFEDVTVESGETKNLGDIQIKE